MKRKHPSLVSITQPPFLLTGVGTASCQALKKRIPLLFHFSGFGFKKKINHQELNPFLYLPLISFLSLLWKKGILFVSDFNCMWHVCICMPMQVWAGRWMSSSMSLHFRFWGRASHWTWRLTEWLGCLASKFQGFCCLSWISIMWIHPWNLCELGSS